MRKGRAQCLVTRGNKILMVKHSVDGIEYYCLPGGGIEGDELPEAAAKRELLEECQVTGENLVLVSQMYHDNHYNYTYYAEIGEQEPILGTDPEITDTPILIDVTWCTLWDLCERDRAYLWAAGLLAVDEFAKELDSWNDDISYPGKREVYESKDITGRSENENSKVYWEGHNTYRARDCIKTDDWLSLFLDEIKTCSDPIPDLGCGSGNNTLTLIRYGKTVIPCDFSKNAINNIKTNFPEVEQAMQFDLIDGLPFEDNFTKVVVADLCLHYFTIEQTSFILEEIKRVVKPGGILLARFNSIQDVNHGAGKGDEIERHLYRTEDNRFKRFFDEIDIQRIFGKYKIEYVKERTMIRYSDEKKLWVMKVRF